MKKKILITAYAVNPYKGSEDGTGWNIIRQLSRYNNILAITRRNNRHDIEKYFQDNPSTTGQQPQFAYFDLPKWMSFWKKGGRGALLYHYLWHLGVVFFILKNRFRFDLAHHLNFHSDWTPSFLWLLGKPFVWGPVGHHHKIPKSYILHHGIKPWLKDRLMWWTKKCFWTFDPFLKIARWNAACVIGINSSVFHMLKVPAHKRRIIPAVATEQPDYQRMDNDRFQVLSIGRFVPLKGFDLAIRAFADRYHQEPESNRQKMQLTLIGKGPERENLKILAKECRLPDAAIRFIDWISREELTRYFAASKVFLFPSHEGAGMVIPEALSFGVPVVCFDNYGPGEFVDESCALKVPYTSYGESVKDFSSALQTLLNDETYRSELATGAVTCYQEKFTWVGKAGKIQSIYDGILHAAPAYAVSG